MREAMNFSDLILVAASSTIVRSLFAATLLTIRANSALDERCAAQREETCVAQPTHVLTLLTLLRDLPVEVE